MVKQRVTDIIIAVRRDPLVDMSNNAPVILHKSELLQIVLSAVELA